MSEPITQNYATESGAAPSYPRDIADHNSNVIKTDNSDRSTGKRLNDWGPWVAIAIGLGAMAFGGMLIEAILTPEIIDARTAEKAAPAIEQANTARREARIAIDQVQTMRLELAKKGIHIQLDDHQ